MQHYHYTGIQHTHDITDNGHEHGITADHYGSIQNFGEMTQDTSYGAGRIQVSNGATYAYSVKASNSTTGIIVNSLANNQKDRFSSGSISDIQSTPRTQTDSNNQYATETRPTNFTVKIWKRTA